MLFILLIMPFFVYVHCDVDVHVDDNVDDDLDDFDDYANADVDAWC